MLCRFLPATPGTIVDEYRRCYRYDDLYDVKSLENIPYEIVPPGTEMICTVSRFYISPKDIQNRVMWFKIYVYRMFYFFRSSPDHQVFEIKLTNYGSNIFDVYISGKAVSDILQIIGSSMINTKTKESEVNDTLLEAIRMTHLCADKSCIPNEFYRPTKYFVNFERFILPDSFYDEVWEEYDRSVAEKARQQIETPEVSIATVATVLDTTAPGIENVVIEIPASAMKNVPLPPITNNEISLSDRWGPAPTSSKKRETQSYYSAKKW